MKKFLILIGVIFLTLFIAGFYGILHDQLTYSISAEYYTKFKFHQFGLVDGRHEVGNPRMLVALVGFMATWWMGIPVGLILGLTGLIHENWRTMLRITAQAIAVGVVTAFITGLAGLAYGYFVLADRPSTSFSGWFIPEGLVDFKRFISVGSMHNFSYLGGVFGLIVGLVYSIFKKRDRVNYQRKLWKVGMLK